MATGPIPELSSAERLQDCRPGPKVISNHGPAWRAVQMSVFALTAREEQFDIPAVSEPFIAWVTGGVARTEEPDLGGAS